MSVVVVVVLLYFLDPTQYALMPKCPFKMLTGFSCGGCGFQRALHALLHGHLIEAINYNVYLVYAAPYALGIVIESWVLKGEWQRKVKAVLEHKFMIYTYVVSFCVWMVVRNIIGK